MLKGGERNCFYNNYICTKGKHEGCVSHMEQELLKIQEDLCSPSGVRVAGSVVFCVLFVLLPLSIILSVLL